MEARVLDRYNSQEGAESYRDEYRKKLHRKYSDRLERRLFERLFAETGPIESMLDLPCGRGRLRSLFLEHAESVVEGDWSLPMLVSNRGDNGADARVGYLRADGLELPFAEGAFDAIVSVRLNHHMPDERERERHVQELMRVARRFVIFTFFDYHSLKNRWRRVRARFRPKRPKSTMRVDQVARLARDAGWRLRMAPQLSMLGSGHRFALLARDADGKGQHA